MQHNNSDAHTTMMSKVNRKIFGCPVSKLIKVKPKIAAKMVVWLKKLKI